MLLLLAAVGVGVVALLPRLRGATAPASAEQRWDHFLVASGLRPVPVTMPDVVAVARGADIPPAMLDRVALGRAPDSSLLLVAQLANDRVLVAVRRAGPRASVPGLMVTDGWQLQLLPGPPARAWEATVLRGAPPVRL